MEGPQDQIPWPWGAGKEFVFSCKGKGEAFCLSWHRDPVCILSSPSSTCVKGVGLALASGTEGCPVPHVEFHRDPEATHPVQHAAGSSRSSWGGQWFLLAFMCCFPIPGNPLLLRAFPPPVCNSHSYTPELLAFFFFFKSHI